MKADLLRLGRTTLIYGVGNVLVRAVQLLLLPLFTTYLTPIDYGISSILGVLIFFLTPIFALGVSGAIGIVYFERPEWDRKAATIWTTVVIMVASAGTLIALGLLGGDQVADAIFPGTATRYDLPYLVNLSVLTAAVTIVAQPPLLYLQLEERARTFVVITAGSAALSIGISVILIAILGRGVAGFIEAGAIAQTVTLGAVVFAMRRLPFSFRASLATELLRLGLPLVPSFVAIFIMQQSNKFILQDLAGLSAVGVYTVGFNIGLVATLVVGGFTAAWFPFFSGFMRRPTEAPRVFARVLTYYVLGAGLLSLFFFVLARSVVILLTRPAFHDAYVAVGPSAAAQVLVGVHSVLLAGMYLAKDVKYSILIQGLAAVASVLLNLALIPVMGVTGAAIAMALSFVIMVMLQHAWNVVRGYPHIPYEWGRLALFGGGYIVVAALYLQDRDWSFPLESAVAIVACLGTVLFAIALLSSAERARAISMVRARFGADRSRA